MKRLNAIINAIPDFIFVSDRNGTYLEYFKLNSQDLLYPENLLIGSTVSNVFDEETANLHLCKINECIDEQRLISFEYSASKNDSTYYFEARLTPLGSDRALRFVRDITDKKLKENEIKKLSLAVEQSPVIIVITDLDANIEYVNPAFQAITGYQLSEVIGKNARLLKSGLTNQMVYKNMWDTITQGNDWYGEWMNKKKNGDLYWENVSITPIRDDNGKMTNYLAVKQDVTQRRHTEDILKQSEEKYRFMFVNNPQPMWIYDQTTLEFLEVNSAAVYHYGYSREEFLSMTLKDIRPAEDIPALLDDIKLTFNRFNSGGEWRHLKKNGEIIQVEIVSHPITFKDRHARHILVNDITKRKQVETEIFNLNANLEISIEERTSQLVLTNNNLQSEIEERKRIEEALQIKTTELENFFSVALDLLCIADDAGNFIKVNKSWEDVLGYSAAELECKKFLEFVHPDDVPSTLDIMVCLREQNPVLSFTNRYKTRDGSYRFMEWHAVPVGNLFYAAARDITERKRAEEFENELLQLSPALTGLSLSKIDDAINLALSRIGHFLSADRSYIFEFDPSGTMMNNTKEWCNEGINPEIENLQNIPCEILPKWMETLLRHENIVITSVGNLPESWRAEREILEPQGIKSLIVIPMLAENSLVGFVGLDSVNEFKEYKVSEINILKVWSSMLASLINDQRTETILEQTRQNYETFFNTIDDFLFVIDQHGNIIHTNTTVNNRLEFTKEELYNQSFLSVHPSGRREEAGLIVDEMLAGIAEYCPVPIVAKSGLQIPVETRVKHGNWNGQPVIFGVSKDITQIKLSEQKFSSAFHSNSAMMSISGFYDGYHIDVNAAFVEVLGYSREEVLGKTNRDFGIFVDPELRDRIIKQLSNGIPVRKMEVLMRSKGGELRTGLLSCDTIYIGEKKCLLSVNMDITERKKAEEDIQNARNEAELANLAKSEFLSRMSHELRTPMNSILGFAQLLEMGDLNSGQKKGVSHILKSGKHLLDLINEVLDISRIEAGRLSLSVEPVKLDGVIKEMIDIVKLQANERGIKIDFVNTPTNHLFVKSDRQRLKQILLNLLNNAIKYNADKGSVIVNTQINRSSAADATMIRISITDTGRGISEEDLPKIFKPFERIGAEKTGTEGTGLGLSVVQKLMNAMGGHFGVESELGIGSTFWIELPESVSPVDKAAHSGKLTVQDPNLVNKTGTILYIEDNLSNIDLVEQILNNQRADLRLITNIYGKNAVQLAIEYEPNLILLDLNLPDVHGSDVLRFLRAEEQTRHIPVVIISADAMPQQMNNLLQAGAENYLTKPLDVLELLKVVDSFLKPQQ